MYHNNYARQSDRYINFVCKGICLNIININIQIIIQGSTIVHV